MRFLVVLIFGFISLFAANSKALNIPVITVKYGVAESSKEFLATTAFAEDKFCVVSPKFGGYAENIYADIKYKVISKNEVLFDFYSPELVSAVNEAIKIKEYAKAVDDEHAKAMLNSSIERLKYLGLSNEDINKELAKPFADRVQKFRSNCSGAIAEKEIFKGSAFNAGQKLYSVVDNSSLWLEIKIYEADIKDIKVGQNVDVYLNGYDSPLKAKIIKILPEINPKDRSLTARAILQNKNGKISANMFGKAKIELAKESGIVVPKTAVLDKNGKLFVFMQMSDGKFEPQEITAKKSGLNFVVSGGLKAGDKIANNALFVLDSDAKIQGLY